MWDMNLTSIMQAQLMSFSVQWSKVFHKRHIFLLKKAKYSCMPFLLQHYAWDSDYALYRENTRGTVDLPTSSCFSQFVNS